VFGRTCSDAFVPSTVRRRALDAWATESERRAETGLPPLRPIALHECRHTAASVKAG
jgi:hypothetical protein